MRRSPTRSAAASKLGERMVGNDGFEWVVVKASNGVQRWARAGRLPRKGAAAAGGAPGGAGAGGRAAGTKGASGKGAGGTRASAGKGAASGKRSSGGAARRKKGDAARRSAALLEGKIPLHHRPRNEAERAAWIRQHPRMLKLVATGDPKDARKLSREEAIRRLREMRDVWEVLTTRCQDLSDARLESETTTWVKRTLAWYWSDESRALATPWLVDAIKLLSRD